MDIDLLGFPQFLKQTLCVILLQIHQNESTCSGRGETDSGNVVSPPLTLDGQPCVRAIALSITT